MWYVAHLLDHLEIHMASNGGWYLGSHTSTPAFNHSAHSQQLLDMTEDKTYLCQATLMHLQNQRLCHLPAISSTQCYQSYNLIHTYNNRKCAEHMTSQQVVERNEKLVMTVDTASTTSDTVTAFKIHLKAYLFWFSYNTSCHFATNLIICRFSLLNVLAFRASMLLGGCQEGHPAHKNLTDEVLEWLSSEAKCK